MISEKKLLISVSNSFESYSFSSSDCYIQSSSGDVQILPGHSGMMTTIDSGLLKMQNCTSNNDTHHDNFIIRVEGGVVKVADDKVVVIAKKIILS